MTEPLLGRKANTSWGTHSKKEWRHKEQREWQEEILEELDCLENDVVNVEFLN